MPHQNLDSAHIISRFQQMRGRLSPAEHDAELAFVRAELEKVGAPHWREFLAAWKS